MKITQHAIDRYRERVVACPERQRSDELIRATIESLVQSNAPKKFRRTGFAKFKPWGMFVLEFHVVKTVLGPMMPERR